MEQNPSRILIVGEVAGPIRADLAGANCELIPVADLNEAIGRTRADSSDGNPITAILSDPSRLTLPEAAEPATQQKLDALYRAGSELAGLDEEQLSDLDVESRVELLKQNLRRTIHDLLRYDVIEIRLLDRSTGLLMPLLAEGMTPEAESRRLRAENENNGVTGFVAATGRSYLCHDTVADPRYLQGSHNARSSLTVPLTVQGEVIGTFNVESPLPNAFTADDMRFTELFASQLAQALHTLRLLSAQQTCTFERSIDSINREVALPVDEILVRAATLLDGSESDAESVLREIMEHARGLRESVRGVGGQLAPVPPHRTQKGHDTAALVGRRVLVVDPDERTRRAAHSLLDRYGCVVETADTATRGIALARTWPFDAILMDIRLPDLGGYDTYCSLRDARPESRVIMMTVFGYDSAHSIVKARADGMRFVLFKPFRLDQVLDALLSPEVPAATQVS